MMIMGWPFCSGVPLRARQAVHRRQETERLIALRSHYEERIILALGSTMFVGLAIALISPCIPPIDVLEVPAGPWGPAGPGSPGVRWSRGSGRKRHVARQLS